MAGGGFFLGGAAEGAMGAQKMALAERAQTEQTGIQGRQLALQESQFQNTVAQQIQAQADAQIAKTMEIVSETIKQGVATGSPPATIMKVVGPVLQSITQSPTQGMPSLAQRAGRDPATLAAQVQAEIARPGAVQIAETAGTASGRGRVATAAATQQIPLPPGPTAAAPAGTPVSNVRGAPVTPGQPTTTAPAKVPNVNLFETEEQRVSAEARMADDYTKLATPFMTVRDNWQNITTLPGVNNPKATAKDFGAWTGSNDLALVFSFMKMVDPGSVVMPGERATAANAAGVPEAVRGAWNNLLGNGQLSAEARRQMVDQAKSIYGERSKAHDKLTSQFAQRAQRTGLRVENVVMDLFPEGVRPTGTSGGVPIVGRSSTGVPFNFRP